MCKISSSISPPYSALVCFLFILGSDFVKFHSCGFFPLISIFSVVQTIWSWFEMGRTYFSLVCQDKSEQLIFTEELIRKGTLLSKLHDYIQALC